MSELPALHPHGAGIPTDPSTGLDLGNDANGIDIGLSQPPLARVASYERTVARDAVSPGLSNSFGSVVLLEVMKVAHSYLVPWQMSSQWGSCGTGFSIWGKRILTNAHVVKDAIEVRLRKHGDSRRWRARVDVVGHDVDLAIVTLHEALDEEEVNSFWSGMSPASWASELPSLQSSVNVVGYPTGGKTICVTEGVISRIDASTYHLGVGKAPGRLLIIQIDAPINPGNSGGPCYNKIGQVVGVAFQGLRSANNVGYIIPATVAQNFLAALVEKEVEIAVAPEGPRPPLEQVSGTGASARHGLQMRKVKVLDYPGLQECPLRVNILQSEALRKYLKVPKSVTGVAVTEVAPLAKKAALANGCETFLQEDDVITHIDDRVIGDDWTVRLREDELLYADFLITGKRKGEKTKFTLLRDTKELTVETELGPLVPNVPRYEGIDTAPNWVIIGGMLFVRLTCPLLQTSKSSLEASGYLTIFDDLVQIVKDFRKDEGGETVILINMFASETNYGYGHHGWRIIESLNGTKIKDLAHLYYLYVKTAKRCLAAVTAAAGETTAEAVGKEVLKLQREEQFLVFLFQDKTRIVLETTKCMASEREILTQQGIPSATSDDVFDQVMQKVHEEELKNAGGQKAEEESKAEANEAPTAKTK